MALIPPIYMDCVVAIGTRRDGNLEWVASGFIYGDLIIAEPKRYYQRFLVTNRHVMEGIPNIILRFNPRDGAPAREIVLSAGDKQRVTYHPNSAIDIAVLPIAGQSFRDQGFQLEMFQRLDRAASLSEMSSLGIIEGDGVFILGFPMGLVGVERSVVIVRSGIIARVQGAYAGHELGFLVDSSVFPGNSGGPVISKPEPMGIQGTPINDRSVLIGVVESFLEYSGSNSGLAHILPIDFVEETVAHAIDRLPDLQSLRENPVPPP